MESHTRFLAESALAERIKIPSRVIIHRSAISPGSLAGIIQSKSFAPKEPGICELEAGGQTLARGKIVKRGGEAFFKVLEIEEVER
jgi:hypothetical protein